VRSAMNRLRFSTLAHHDHVVCNPISLEKLDRVLGLLDLAPGARVLDVGCGKGEMLIRLIERFEVRGVGVDLNAEFLDEARARAAARVPAADLTLLETPFEEFDHAPGSFDAALCVGSTHACGGYAKALRALARAVRPGGPLVVGEGYWKRDPDPGYLSVLGAARDEMSDHAGNVAAGIEQGLTPLYSVTGSDDDWDHYEGLYARAIERFAAEHPDDPDCDAMLTRIRRWRDAYLRWGRDTLGFGFYLFRKERG